jgi:hypothetical protein
MEHTPFETLLKNHPGIDRGIIKILNYRLGKSMAIGGDELTSQVIGMGYQVDNRNVREIIHGLRRQKYLICGLPGIAGGYFMATNLEEFEEFADKEFKSKIRDMGETLNAMQAAARERFGDAIQRSLF